MSIRAARGPRRRLLVHLSQAVETLAVRKMPGCVEVPLQGSLDGRVKLQGFEVSSREFDHFENISGALDRLDRGTYGRCVFCGGGIGAAVLERTPWANECLACGDQEPQP